MKKLFFVVLFVPLFLCACRKELTESCITFCTTPWIHLISPDGTQYRPGSMITITWESCGMSDSIGINLTAKKLTIHGGPQSWVITERYPNTGMYTIEIPLQDQMVGTWYLEISAAGKKDGSKTFVIEP